MRVYKLLKNRFILNFYSPCKPLDIADLANDCGVSHIPVREALVRLSAEGLVDHVPKRGFFSRSCRFDALLQDYEFIYFSLFSISKKLTKKTIHWRIRPDISKHLLISGIDLFGDFVAEELTLELESFYKKILDLNGNAVMTEAFMKAVDRTHYFRRIDFEMRGSLEEHLHERQAFVSALAGGDADQLESIVDNAFENRERYLQAVFEEMNYRLSCKFEQSQQTVRNGQFHCSERSSGWKNEQNAVQGQPE